MATKIVCTNSPTTTSLSPSAFLSTTLPFPLASNLDCEIHPLFAYKNWECVSQEDYELIKPALRLATMYLNTPSCLAFFATCLFSERECDDNWNISIEKESTLTTFKAERVKEMLLELDGVVRLTFQNCGGCGEMHGMFWQDFTDEEKADIEWHRCHEKSNPWSARKSLKHGKTVDEIEGEEMEFCVGPEEIELRDSDLQYLPPEQRPYTHIQDPRTRMTFCTLVLNNSLLRTLQSQRSSPEQALRGNFRLVGIILHELAHAVERGRNENREFMLPNEAKFPGATLTEMGHQLEMVVFGGIYQPVANPNAPKSNREEDALEAVVSDWPLRSSTSLVYDVPLEFLARVHQQEYWNHTDFSIDQSSYKLPRAEPRSDSAELALRFVNEIVDFAGTEYATAHYVILEDLATCQH